MAHIGSVFLGDTVARRHRLLSSNSNSTPPSSPPPTAGMSGVFTGLPSPPLHSPHSPVHSASHLSIVETNDYTATNKSSAVVIDPAMSLELRLRWIEAIVLGVKQDNARDRKGKEREKQDLRAGETMTRAAETLQRRLDTIVESNDGLKRFMNHYDQHAHLLTPSFALSGLLPDPPAYENMTSSELEAFLTEMENDIRAADRDMREIDVLEKKGVTGAGKLADYEDLQPRLVAVLKSHQENVDTIAALEKRIAGIMERHATQVDALSELFVLWDDTITDAENKVTRLEREREERRRLGME